jgi:hypothetical protein
LQEAESLIAPGADRLIKVAPVMGPKMRASAVPAALERAIRLYQQREKAQPGQGYAAKGAEWQAKLDSFRASLPPKAAPLSK